MSVRTEQLGSKWTDFHDIWYLSIFRKSAEQIQASLKSDKNNGTIHEDRCTFMMISRWILFRMRNVSDKSCTQILCSITPPRPPKIVLFMRELQSRTGHRRQRDACALHAGYLRLQTYIQTMWYLLLCHWNNGCTNALHCYIITTLPLVTLWYNISFTCICRHCRANTL